MSATDAKDIKMNIVHVILVSSNIAFGVFLFTKRDLKIDSKMESVSEAVIRIESNQKENAAESKIWQSKVEAELADLRLRTALLEARVFTNKR